MQRLLFVIWVVSCSWLAAAQSVWPSNQQAFIATADANTYQAWQIDTRQGKVQTQDLQSLSTPLGSIWKLFVYAYLVENHSQETPYQCQGRNREEKYCCSAGQSIQRNQALLQSCGLYFEPQRLGISETQWRSFWYQQRAPLWLTELSQVNEHSTIPVRDLLWGLQQIPPAAQQQAQQVLLNVWLRSSNAQSLSPLGSQFRGKTYTMPHPLYAQQRIGGMAGWLNNGQAFWLMARGNSQQVLQHSHSWLPIWAQQQTKLSDARAHALQDACIEVDYLAFMTNPIISVRHQAKQQVMYGGLLPAGDYEVTLKNKRRVNIHSAGDLTLYAQTPYYRIRGRMGVNEYVARVLQREASTEPEQAAKALSIAIRTYAFKEATMSGSCLLMRDTTLQQRVQTQPASITAKRIAESTDQLVLHGAYGHFKDYSTQPGILGWQQAQNWAQQGLDFKAILARAYPNASIVVHDSDLSERCTPLPLAQKWLTTQAGRWHNVVIREPGYRALTQAASICQLSRGTPYADIASNRIYIRRLKTEAEQLTLTHEYLHLLFADHPNGRNEHYIEALAQRLLKG